MRWTRRGAVCGSMHGRTASRGRSSRMVPIPRRWYPACDDAHASRRPWWPTSPVHQEEYEAAVKTSASTEPVVPAACIFFCRRAMGAASSRPSLRPLTPEGERDQHHSGSTCRGRALLCLHTVIARRLRGYDGCGGGAIFCLNRGSPTTRVHGIAQSRDSSPGGHTASRRLSLPLPSVSFRRCC